MEIHLLEYTEQHKMLSLGMLQNGVKNLEEIRKEPATMALILINVLVFIAVEFTGTSQDAWHVLEYGAAYTPYIIQNGEVYRLFTSMFLHFGITHLMNNMVMLGALGWNLELEIGKLRFIIIYFLSGIGGNILSLIAAISAGESAVSAGASGAVFGLMGALLYVVIANRGRLGQLSGRGMIFMVVLSLYFGLTSSGVDNMAHIGGLICGFIFAVILYRPKKIHYNEY